MAASFGRLARSASVYSSRSSVLRGTTSVSNASLMNATWLQRRQQFSSGALLRQSKKDEEDSPDGESRQEQKEEALDAAEDVEAKSSQPTSRSTLADAAESSSRQESSKESRADHDFKQFLSEFPPEKRQQLINERDRLLASADSDQFWDQLSLEAERIAKQIHRKNPEEDPENIIYRQRAPQGFLATGEDDPWMTMDDPSFQEDDISLIAHAELEEHREYRQYVRLAAWEMPLLTKLATKYVKPDKSKPLRFRYTTYLGDQHPSEQKVVMEVTTGDLPDLTQLQREKLIKLVGSRYNPETDVVRMSCEMFETSAQNKKYLKDTLKTLLQEAKNGKDTLADIPLDFRYHKFKQPARFPKEWIATPQRLEALEQARDARLQKHIEKMDGDKMIDGPSLVSRHLASLPTEALVASASSSSQGQQGSRRPARR